MAAPDNARLIALLAALSRHTNLSVGCYCEEEGRCHRSVLRELLAEAGATLEQEDAPLGDHHARRSSRGT